MKRIIYVPYLVGVAVTDNCLQKWSNRFWTNLSGESLSIHSVFGSSRVATSPVAVVLFQFVDVVHQRSAAQNCRNIVTILFKDTIPKLWKHRRNFI